MTTHYCSHACNSKAYKASKREETRKQLNEQTAGKQFNMVAINYSTAQKIEKISDAYEKIKNKEFLSVSETAILLSVGRVTVYRYHVKINNIPKIKDGRYVKISKEELEKLFENKIIIQP